MKAPINPFPCGAAILWITAAFLLLLPSPASASQRVVISGWVTPATAPFDSCDYVVRSGPGEPVQMALSDPAQRIFGDVPGYQRLTVELTTTWFDLSTGEVPKLVVFQVHPPATLALKGLSCGTDPGRFAACDNGLYPVLDEPLPRNLLAASGGSTVDPDSDGDGVPDSQDAFPDDPNETTDTDGDGIGNNADPDDDNDSMPDTYEEENGLNSLVDDADGDLDHDGQTNAQEAVAGSRANDPGSYFRIGRLEPPRAGTIGLIWQALPGRSYSIYYTPDLRTRPAAVLTGITVPRAGPHREDVEARRNSGFYYLRAEWLAAP